MPNSQDSPPRVTRHIFDEPKIDCHAHVIDPARFPYNKNVAYKPSGQEVGTTAQFREVMKIYGVKHALLVQPNSGYEDDNSCMLNAIEKARGVSRASQLLTWTPIARR